MGNLVVSSKTNNVGRLRVSSVTPLGLPQYISGARISLSSSQKTTRKYVLVIEHMQCANYGDHQSVARTWGHEI
jgi:hypothetical protein